MKNIIEDIFSAIIFVVFIIWLCVAWLTTEPSGYYEATETMQPDGNYYIWVEDKI